MNFDHVSLGIEVVIPYPLQQHCAGHYLTRMAHQILEQAKFSRLHINVLIVTFYFSGEQIKFQIIYPKRRVLRGDGTSSPQRFDPCEEL